MKKSIGIIASISLVLMFLLESTAARDNNIKIDSTQGSGKSNTGQGIIVGKDGAIYRVNPNTGLPGVSLNVKIKIGKKEYLLADNLITNKQGKAEITNVPTILSKSGVNLAKTTPPYLLNVFITSFKPSTDFPTANYSCSMKVTAGGKTVPFNVSITTSKDMSGPFSQSLSNIEDGIINIEILIAKPVHDMR